MMDLNSHELSPFAALRVYLGGHADPCWHCWVSPGHSGADASRPQMVGRKRSRVTAGMPHHWVSWLTRPRRVHANPTPCCMSPGHTAASASRAPGGTLGRGRFAHAGRGRFTYTLHALRSGWHYQLCLL